MAMSYPKGVSLPSAFFLVSATTVGTEKILAALSGLGGAKVRGLLCGSAGYLNVTMSNGVVCAGLPFQAGINPGEFASVQISTSGTPAQNIWAIV